MFRKLPSLLNHKCSNTKKNGILDMPTYSVSIDNWNAIENAVKISWNVCDYVTEKDVFSIDLERMIVWNCYIPFFSCVLWSVPQISSVSAYNTQFKMPNTHRISFPGVSDTHVKFYFTFYIMRVIISPRETKHSWFSLPPLDCVEFHYFFQ